MRLALALVVLLALVPAAAAQVPAPPDPCGPLGATATGISSGLAPGEQGDVSVQVTNNGTRAASVVVTISSTSEGWTIVTPQEQQATVEGEATATFPFTVRPTGQARDTFTASFAIEGTCALPAPGVDCPQGVCTAPAPSPVGASVPLNRPPSGGLPGLDNLNLPLPYLIAGVVLVGVAAAVPLLLRKRGGGFVAECPEPLKMVRPGRGTSFPIEVRNAGAEPLTVQFDIGPVPEGWTAFMPLPEVQLAAKEARSLWLMVRSPPEAPDGEAVDVEVRLRNPVRPDNATTVRVRAEVNSSMAEGAGRA